MFKNKIKLVTLLFIFILGLYYYLTKNCYSCKEGSVPFLQEDPPISGFEPFENFMSDKSCPNKLIQKGDSFYLFNSRLAKVPGVNPVRFSNLSEYEEYVSWQKSQGIHCPILHLQEIYDTQGNPVYKTRDVPNHYCNGTKENDVDYNLPYLKLENQPKTNAPMDKIYNSQEDAIQAGLITKFDPNIFDPRY